ncbi:MAG: tetratricopeptide repeat protein [candidate division WOR-3 bacterium]|nr:tetratricopeptide repeat protein [candidate division WOR-3 bacterium]
MKKFLIFFLLLSNCAYYNTFYNAQKYYSDGVKQEKEGGSGAGNFQKSVEKCEKVLKRYSGSKWVDDAIFLLGKDFYYLHQLSKAKVNFEKIISDFSDSPFFDESLLFLGKIALNEGSLSESVIFLNRAAESKDSRIRMEAFKTNMEVYLKKDSPGKAIQAGEDFIQKYGTHIAEVYYILGSAYRDAGKYSEALKMFKRAMKESEKVKPEDLIYRLALTYVTMDSLSQALSLIDQNQGNDSITILKGEILQRLGELDRAEETFKSAENFRNRLGVIANYHLGQIKEEKGDIKSAQKLYSKALNLGVFGDITDKARAKGEILEISSNMDSLRSDTLTKGKDPAYLNFRVGELYALELKEPGEAVKWYENVFRDFPESPYAPKALYVLMNIYTKELVDSTKVRECLDLLLNHYPDTKYSEAAREEYATYLQDTTSNRK